MRLSLVGCDPDRVDRGVIPAKPAVSSSLGLPLERAESATTVHQNLNACDGFALGVNHKSRDGPRQAELELNRSQSGTQIELDQVGTVPLGLGGKSTLAGRQVSQAKPAVAICIDPLQIRSPPFATRAVTLAP